MMAGWDAYKFLDLPHLRLSHEAAGLQNGATVPWAEVSVAKDKSRLVLQERFYNLLGDIVINQERRINGGYLRRCGDIPSAFGDRSNFSSECRLVFKNLPALVYRCQLCINVVNVL